MAGAAMKPPPVYELHEIRKKQGDSFELQIPELSVASGDTLGLVGPIGAGKSTLLRLLSGLDKPTSGRARLQGEAIEYNQLPLAMLRQVATVHQRPILLSATVRYNVEYGLKVRGVHRRHDRIETVLASLGLNHLGNRDARTLSGGQVQLVALARALAVRPAVLLLDEPTAHLDPATVALVERVLQEYSERLGITAVWATHNLFQARRVASQVGLLLNGQLIEVADAKTFFDHPKDQRTVDFVQGKMVY
jgi:tungstate transport system ATP-binding protein